MPTRRRVFISGSFPKLTNPRVHRSLPTKLPQASGGRLRRKSTPCALSTIKKRYFPRRHAVPLGGSRQVLQPEDFMSGRPHCLSGHGSWRGSPPRYKSVRRQAAEKEKGGAICASPEIKNGVDKVEGKHAKKNHPAAGLPVFREEESVKAEGKQRPSVGLVAKRAASQVPT